MKNKGIAFWLVVIGLFGGLVALRGQVPEQKTVAVSGADITNGGVANKCIQFNGTVASVKKNYTGLTLVTIQPDDGWPVIVMIPPTVGARVPSVGTGVAITGALADAGMIRVDSREGIRVLPHRLNSYPFVQDISVAPERVTYRSRGIIRCLGTMHNRGSKEVTVSQGNGEIDAHLMAGTGNFRDGEDVSFLFYRQDGKVIICEVNP